MFIIDVEKNARIGPASSPMPYREMNRRWLRQTPIDNTVRLASARKISLRPRRGSSGAEFRQGPRKQPRNPRAPRLMGMGFRPRRSGWSTIAIGNASNSTRSEVQHPDARICANRKPVVVSGAPRTPQRLLRSWGLFTSYCRQCSRVNCSWSRYSSIDLDGLTGHLSFYTIVIRAARRLLLNSVNGYDGGGVRRRRT
jgi:hypothetical protein